MKSAIKLFSVLLGASLVLVSCSIENSNDQLTSLGASRGENLYKNDDIKKPDSLVSKSDAVYMSGKTIKMEHKVTLPKLFQKTLLYTTANAESLSVTMSNIAKLTKQSITLDDSARSQLETIRSTAAIVSYQGTLETVLNQICDKYHLYWVYKKGVVTVFALETKMFALDAPVGAFTLDNMISSTSNAAGAGGGGAGGGSSVGGNSSMDLRYTFDQASPWSAAVDTIETMLSPRGKLNSNPVEGYVTVTDSPKVLKRISDYVKKINDRTNKKIAIRVDVYDVMTNSSSDFGLNVNALVHVLSNDVEISSAMSDYLNADNAGYFTSFNFKGSGDTHNVVLNALNTIGKASSVTGTTVYTVSGQPAPVQSTQSKAYLASTETTVDEGVTTTSMSPGTVVTGYSMTVMPRIQSNNQILVNLNLQISSLVQIETFSATSAGSEEQTQIQLPETKNKNFLESMVLHNGQSILIAGFQDDTSSSNTASPTSIDMWQAGGAKSTQRSKSTTVIVVTPYIIGD